MEPGVDALLKGEPWANMRFVGKFLASYRNRVDDEARSANDKPNSNGSTVCKGNRRAYVAFKEV